MLAVLAINKIFDACTPSPARLLTYVVVAWIVPQLIYLGLTEAINSDQNSFQFLDRLVLIPSQAADNSTSRYTVGFMICIHQLAQPVITQVNL